MDVAKLVVLFDLLFCFSFALIARFRFLSICKTSTNN